MRNYRNDEGYMDNTAGVAIARASKEKFLRDLEASKGRMTRALADVEKELSRRGYSFKGNFKLIEERTGFYLVINRKGYRNDKR